jgi:predicted nucleotidyltransferase
MSLILHQTVFDKYTGNQLWLKDRTLVLMKNGSHAYGTNGPGSDIDIKGVAVQPRSYDFGFIDSFEQANSGFGEYDCCIYELRKFMKLATDCNPNIIELVWTDENDLIYVTPAWEKLYNVRHLFLSQNAKYRFSGYAMAQLKRIRTHRDWITNPMEKEPTRTEFKLPEYTAISADQRQAAESQIKKQVEAWRIDLAEVDDGLRVGLLRTYEDALEEISAYSNNNSVWTAAGRKLGFDDNFLEYLEQERGYRAAHQRFKQYQEWKRSRNAARHELEEKYGYDTKHGMHLIRLMRMAHEIMRGEGVIVKRPDAEELKAIRNGAWSLDKILAEADAYEKGLEDLVKNTKLPKQPNRTALNKLCIEIVESMS